jgi:hypothetical protein
LVRSVRSTATGEHARHVITPLGRLMASFPGLPYLLFVIVNNALNVFYSFCPCDLVAPRMAKMLVLANQHNILPYAVTRLCVSDL